MAGLAETVLSAQEGENGAFADLVRSYYAAVLGVCAGYARDSWMAEDLAQETFLRAYTHLGELRDPEGFWPWLRKVAQNTCLTALRQARLRKSVPAGDSLDRVPDTPGEIGALPLRDLVQRLVADLPEDYRLPLYLHYVRGCSYRETAQLLALSEALVRSRLFEGRRRLRQKLKGAAEDMLRQTAPLDVEINALVARCQGSATCRCGRVLLEP